MPGTASPSKLMQKLATPMMYGFKIGIQAARLERATEYQRPYHVPETHYTAPCFKSEKPSECYD